MSANNSTATGGLGATGRQPTQPPPPRSSTFSHLYRKVTGKPEKPTAVKTTEQYIAKYELDWATLKGWLDERFAQYNCTFTERFNVQGDKYVVSLPEELSEKDKLAIAKLKKKRATT